MDDYNTVCYDLAMKEVANGHQVITHPSPPPLCSPLSAMPPSPFCFLSAMPPSPFCFLSTMPPNSPTPTSTQLILSIA